MCWTSKSKSCRQRLHFNKCWLWFLMRLRCMTCLQQKNTSFNTRHSFLLWSNFSLPTEASYWWRVPSGSVCNNTAPGPNSRTSVCRTKDWSKSEAVKIGTSTHLGPRVTKPSWQLSVHWTFTVMHHLHIYSKSGKYIGAEFLPHLPSFGKM